MKTYKGFATTQWLRDNVEFEFEVEDYATEKEIMNAAREEAVEALGFEFWYEEGIREDL